MTQFDAYIQTYGSSNPIVHLANPIEFERLQVEPTKVAPAEGDTGCPA